MQSALKNADTEDQQMFIAKAPITQLKEYYDHIIEQKNYYVGVEKQIQARLETMLADVIKDELSKKEDAFGSVNFVFDGQPFKADLPKKVSWNQDALEALGKTIAAEWKENPQQYIKVSYDISETAYKSWPDSLKEKFVGARTVTPGKLKITWAE